MPCRIETVAVSAAEAGVATRSIAAAAPRAPAARRDERIGLMRVPFRVGPACHASFPSTPRRGCTWCRQTATVTSARDRDAEGRARNARPRDALGRPLPYGAAGEERAPEGVVRPPGQALDEAQALLDAGRPFHAHEVLEDAWKSAPEDERELWRGLAQLAVGLTHALRGNATGAATLRDRGAGNIAAYAAAPPYGIDVDGLVRWARSGDDAPPRLRGASTIGRPVGGGDSPE